MNTINYRISLDMLDALSQTTIKAKKGDSACKIYITLTKNGKIFSIGEGCRATFNAKKSDGNFIYDKCTIESDTIVYDFTSSIDENGVCQVSAIEGNVNCEVTLYNAEGEQLTSPRFTLYIDNIVYNGEEIISSPESDVLKGLITEADDLIEEIKDLLEQGGSGNGGNGESTIIEECIGIVNLKTNIYRYHLTLDAEPKILCKDVRLIPKGYSATVVFYNSANKETDKEYWTKPIQSNVLKDIADDGMALTDLIVGVGNDGVLITIYKADENAEKFNWYLSTIEVSENNGIHVGEEEPTEENVVLWINPNGEATPITEGVWGKILYERVPNILVNKQNEKEISFDGYYTEVNNINAYTKVKVKGYQFSLNDYSVCYFLDERGNIIQSFDGAETSKEYNFELDVPQSAKSLIVNGHLYAYPINIEGYKEIGLLDIYEELLKEETINDVWKTIPYSRVDNTIVNIWNEKAQSYDGYYAEAVGIEQYRKIKIKGFQFTENYYVCYFLDEQGRIISMYAGNGINTEFETVVDVPKTAKSLIVNGQIYTNEPVKIEGLTDNGIQEIYDKLLPQGVKLIALGDSITQLGISSRGWIRYFIEKTDCELIANVAVVGACLRDKEGTIYDGNPVFEGADKNVNNVLGNQVQKILNDNYDTPNIIIIAIGTNDGIYITKEQIKAVYYDENNDLIPLESVDRTTSAGAYRWCLEKLHEKYPNATIFWCTPIMAHQKIRSAENVMDWAESLRIATEFTGQVMIDTIRCGINGINEHNGADGEYLFDGLHPNEKGAKKIGYYNASKVIPFLHKEV